MVTNDWKGKGQRKGIGEWGRQWMEGREQETIQRPKHTQMACLGLWVEGVAGGERAEGSSRHENPPDIGRGFVSAWRRTSRNTDNVPKWACWWCSGGERMSGWMDWMGRNAGRHENASHMGCVFVPSRTGWVEKTNRPKWARWWEGMQPDIWDMFLCLVGETPPMGAFLMFGIWGRGKHDENTETGVFITFDPKDT